VLWIFSSCTLFPPSAVQLILQVVVKIINLSARQLNTCAKTRCALRPPVGLPMSHVDSRFHAEISFILFYDASSRSVSHTDTGLTERPYDTVPHCLNGAEFLTSQQLISMSWNLKFHYLVHKSSHWFLFGAR
jgi:hypothetical protein